MSVRSDDKNRFSKLSSSNFHRSLRLIVREEESDDNLFVRLSPGLAYDLLARIQPLDEESSPGYLIPPPDGWTHLDEDLNSSVSFLPLCISVGDSISIHASYNGGTCELSSKEGTFGLVWFSLLSISHQSNEAVNDDPVFNVS